MKPSIYTPIIKKAVQAYFREDDAPIALLNSRQHRRLIDAVHCTYSAMEYGIEREFVEAVYKETRKDFETAVRDAAAARRIGKRHAWDLIHRFTADVERRFVL